MVRNNYIGRVTAIRPERVAGDGGVPMRLAHILRGVCARVMRVCVCAMHAHRRDLAHAIPGASECTASAAYMHYGLCVCVCLSMI